MTDDAAACLFAGVVHHRRLRPQKHKLAYSVTYLLVDIDAVGILGLNLFSLDRFNLFGLRSSDYGAGAGATIRDRVASTLKQHGFSGAGRIRLLTIPRLFGYAFNPISVFFCDGADGELEALIYEVHNTFGERHSYVIGAGAGRPIVQEAQKALHVSPFLPMEMRYRFVVTPPGEKLSLTILDFEADGLTLAASMALTRRPISDGALLRMALFTPFIAVKVILGIHWEALRLWLKGARVHSWRAAPPHATSAGRIASTPPV